MVIHDLDVECAPFRDGSAAMAAPGLALYALVVFNRTSMTQTVKELLDTFDRLPDAEKREAASAILRRVRDFGFELPSDDELVLAAEGLFLELDQREATDERT